MFWTNVARYAAALLVVVAVGLSATRAYLWATTAFVPVPDKKVDRPAAAARPVSKPAVHDDLEVTVSPTQAVFASAQPVTIDINMTNRGARPFWMVGTPWKPKHPYYTLRIASMGDTYRGPWEPGNFKPDADEDVRRISASIRLLQPGETMSIRVVLDQRMQFDSTRLERVDGAKDQRQKWFERLPVGRYEFGVDIDMSKLLAVGALPGGTPHRAWKGQLASHSVAFEIAEAKAGVIHGQTGSGSEHPLQEIYRSAEELRQATGLDVDAAAKRLKVDSIDFDKHMLVHVTLGRWGDNSRLELTGVDIFANGTTVVRCRFNVRKTDVVTRPGVLALIDRIPGNVLIVTYPDR
jgi:hypothetical protein